MANIKLIDTKIEGLYIIEPQIFGDSRDYFLETYNKQVFTAAGLNMEFVQDNESKSVKGVLRGMHYQIKHPQGKLVRVLSGEVYDVAVDMRAGSNTYGQWEGVYLSGENKLMLYVPEGFAHGFVVTSDTAVFSYKCTDFYHPEDEGGFIYNDKNVGIDWPLAGDMIKLSDKDRALKPW